MTYSLLARYYDLENADFTEDLDFWLGLAEEYGDPILELGCGTGRVLLHLARRGYAVTGLDNSPEMLARLEGKLEQAVSMRGRGEQWAAPMVVRADMTDFALGDASTFQLAIMPFNTFMHLLTPEAQMSALTCIRKHLAEGAALVMDVVNPGEVYAAHEQGLTLERTFLDGERTVHQFSSIALDRAAQIGHVTWLYDSVAPDGGLQRTAVPITFRYTFPGEMRLLLERCGFRLAHLYGGYDRSPLTDGSPRMIVIAQPV
jgi:SAM-dependent methyltransferase